MATHLDLEEQEQLDQLKHFWNQYGNLISWILIVILGALAAWNGYQYWQRSQGEHAAAMYEEVDKVVRGGDVAKAERAFNDMKDRYAKASYTQQAALLVAKMSFDAGKTDTAKAALTWLVDNASDKGLGSVGRLRLSAILMDAKAFDDALKLLGAGMAPEFSALADDRTGDIYMLQGKKAEAKAAYLKAYKAFETTSDYRRLVAVKLNALGVDPEADAKPAATKEEAK